MKPSWGCYWAGQWMENIEFAVEQGMELIAVYKPDGQGCGELDCFPSKEDWEGTDGKRFAKDKFLGGSQVFGGRTERARTAEGGACWYVHRFLICTHITSIRPLTCQKKELAYIEKVLGLEIHHKLDIRQFRSKVYERPKVRGGRF